MFLRTKRNVLVNVDSALTISKHGAGDAYLTLATEKHFFKLKAVDGTTDELLEKIAAGIRDGANLLEIDAIVE